MRFASVLFVVLCLAVAPVDGSDPCRNRQVAVQRVQTHQVVSHQYQQAHYQNVYVPQVVEVEVAPAYYFSARDYLRDQALLEAVRALSERAVAPVQSAPPAAPSVKEEKKVRVQTQVDDKLQAIVRDSCAKCHSGGNLKGGFSIDGLASMPSGQRWHMYALVNSGEMPDAANPLPDDDVKAFYEFAKAGAKAEGLARKR